LVIKGGAKDSLLDTYSEERLSIARDLVRSTDRAFNLFSSPNLILRIFRLYIIPIGLKLVVPVFLKFRFLQQFAFKTVSEIGINYRKNILSKNASLGSFPNHAPKPGDRLPFIQFIDESGRETNIQKKVKSNSFSLFVFCDKTPKSLESFKNSVSIETIPLTMQTKILYDKLGLHKDGCYLVRPDMYIAYRSGKFDPEHLTKYLCNFCTNE
jgi:hypothetical protein